LGVWGIWGFGGLTPSKILPELWPSMSDLDFTSVSFDLRWCLGSETTPQDHL